MNVTEIIEWDDSFHQHFIDLSIEWLEKYVSVEPADLKILYHPHRTVLDSGGQIFFARKDNKIVGTIAMIDNGDRSFELAKFAVTEDYKGQKIGALLLQHAICFARYKKAESIILYTNRKLKPAIRLYEKYGFHEVSLSNNKYQEADMKMILFFDAEHSLIH